MKGKWKMGKVAVVYWSGSGNTEEMANAVAQGAGDGAQLIRVSDFGADQVTDYDAIAFGCPAMGDEVLEESEFEPVFEACKPALKGKKIGLFGSYGWGDGQWMRNWEEDCQAAGAVLAAGSVICQDAPDDEANASLQALGSALAN